MNYFILQVWWCCFAPFKCSMCDKTSTVDADLCFPMHWSEYDA